MVYGTIIVTEMVMGVQGECGGTRMGWMKTTEDHLHYCQHSIFCIGLWVQK